MLFITSSILFLTFLAECRGANIFCIFPSPSISHQQPMLAVSRALAERGHNLTVITANPSKVPIKNHREIDINFMYKKWQIAQEEGNISLQRRISPTEIIIGFCVGYLNFMSTHILESPQIQKLIREVNGTQYDLIIYESLGYSSFLGFSHLLGYPPTVGFLTLNHFETADNPVGNPVFHMPNSISAFQHQMTFFERLRNLYYHLLVCFVLEYFVLPYQEQLLHKHFGDVPYTAKQMEYNKSLQIVMSDLSTSYPRPLQPNTLYVGSTLVKPAKPLPLDLQKWMDEAEDGVIYFSLGSNMKGTSVDPEKLEAFIKTFSQFPKMRVIWKWESDNKLPGQPDNVLVKGWLPQVDILAHPKLKLFISQAGLQSFQESITYGVPILAIPMFGDQPYNAVKLVQSGAGLSQEYYDITYTNFHSSVKEMLTNKSYKENMLRLSAISKDKPMASIETAIWWIEYVLRHKGARHLRPATLDLSWYQYLMLDIILFLLAVVTITVYFIYIVIFKVCFSKNNVKTKKIKTK